MGAIGQEEETNLLAEKSGVSLRIITKRGEKSGKTVNYKFHLH